MGCTGAGACREEHPREKHGDHLLFGLDAAPRSFTSIFRVLNTDTRLMDRDTLFRKLRAKPENKVREGSLSCSATNNFVAVDPAVSSLSFLRSLTARRRLYCTLRVGLLRLSGEESNLGVGTVWGVHLPVLCWDPSVAGGALVVCAFDDAGFVDGGAAPDDGRGG